MNKNPPKNLPHPADMTNSLRDRIAAVIAQVAEGRAVYQLTTADATVMADAVIAALGTRRCERCRKAVPLDHFPDPHPGSDEMRPFCIRCTRYIEWATS